MVSAYETGANTIAEIAERFSVGQTFLKKRLRQKRETGSLARLPQRAGAKKIVPASHRRWARQIADHPDATLGELEERVAKEKQVSVSPATVCRALQELQVLRKKSQ